MSSTLELHGLIGQSSTPTPPPAEYIRPVDWLSMPVVLSTDQKFVGLYAIQPDSNFAALSATGNYTVNWGDGTITNHTSNTIAEHQFLFSNVAFNGTLTSRGYKQTIITVTPQAGHQLTKIRLSHIHSSLNQINNAPANWLDLAISSGALTSLVLFGGVENDPVSTIAPLLEIINIFSSNLLTCDYLFRGCPALAVVPTFNITPVAARTIPISITANSSGVINSSSHLLNVGDQLLMDERIITGSPALDTISYVQAVVTGVSPNAFVISASHTASVPYPVFEYTGNVIYGRSFAYMFGSNAPNVRYLPFMNTTGGVNFTGVYQTQSPHVTQIPSINTASGVLFDFFVESTFNLTSVPALNLTNAVSTSYMFNGCTSLKTIPLLNTSTVQNFTYMFAGTSIETIPLINTSSGIIFHSMFIGCKQLTSVPLLDLGNAIQLPFMFEECVSLRTIPLFNTSQATNMSNMFGSCSSLITVPLLDTGNVQFFQSMFQSCISLITTPALNVGLGFSFSDMFYGCYSLTSAPLSNVSQSLPLPTTLIGPTALNELYASLAVVSGSQQLLVSTNYGFASSNQTIATNKGWTLV